MDDPDHSDVAFASSPVAPTPKRRAPYELLLAMEESDYEDKVALQFNEIRKANNDLITIGKTTLDNDNEDIDNDADDDDPDNTEESDGEELEQETG